MAANPAAGQEPPEIVALRLQLQIAEAQRDQAVAEAQVRAAAPVVQQPAQLNYLLPRDYEDKRCENFRKFPSCRMARRCQVEVFDGSLERARRALSGSVFGLNRQRRLDFFAKSAYPQNWAKLGTL